MENKIEVLVNDLDLNNIDSIIKKCLEIREIKSQLEKLNESLKVKLKIYLKEKKWDRYTNPDNKISISIIKQKKEIYDEEKLKLYLSDSQLAQVKRITTFEKLLIITPTDRKRLNQYGRKKS